MSISSDYIPKRKKLNTSVTKKLDHNKMILFWIIGMILSLYIHELGHVTVGLFYHWKLFYFVVGPLKIYRDNMDESIKVGFETDVTHWFGMGATVPGKKDPDN